MKFNTDKKTVFLDPHSELVISDEKLDIILSPSLYWVKKVTLPLKYERDVKKLLVSLFEDVLPEGAYSYSVYKHIAPNGSAPEDGKNVFMIFAYEDKVILDLLQAQGILSANISSIHFAQSELDTLDGAVKINETQSIYVKDDVVTLVPCCWIEESGNLDLTNIKLSKHTITLAQFGHIVDNKSLITIGAILSVFIVLIWIELFIVKQNISKIELESSQIFAKHKLKPTMFQNKSLLKKYKSIHENQTKLRKDFEKILKNKNITKITYKDNNLKVDS